MSAKWSVTPVLAEHFKTMVDERTHRRRAADYVAFFGFPLLVAGVGYWQKIRIQDVGTLLSGVSIFTALLFGLLVHIFGLGLRLTDDPRIPNGSHVVRLIDQTQANVAYSVLVGMIATGAFAGVAATTPKGHAPGRIASAVLIALLVHLGMIILMALKRTSAAYKELRL